MTLLTAPGAWKSPGTLLVGLVGQVPEIWARLPLRSLFDLLLAFAFLPLLSRRMILFTLPLIFAVHLASGHRWHATFYGHYSYSVLPFLMLAGLHGYTILAAAMGRESRRPASRWLPALGLLAIAAYSAAGDKETPLPALPPDARAPQVARVLGDLPRRSCLRTQTFFTAQAPIDLYVFPLEIPRGNPMRDRLPPHAPHGLARGDLPDCREFYVLLDEKNFAPYYSGEYMQRFRALVQGSVARGELSEVPIDSAGNLRLYRAVRSLRESP